MTVVVDASAMLAWCFEDEAPPSADDLLDKLVAEGIAAPSHWTLELANILNLALRKGRLKRERLEAFIVLIQGLGVVIDIETAERALHEVRVRAEEEKLTAFDAAYLELAERLGARLVSKDVDLLAAARRRKVRVMDLSV